MLERISGNVYRWSEIHGEARNAPYTWNSYVIHCPGDGVLALVDPLTMSDDEAREIEEIQSPTHILLTCEYHVRKSVAYRERWGCQVLANRMELNWYDIALDGHFEDGERLWGKVDPIFVPDVKFQETAFLVPEESGVLIVGDLLAGGRQDVGIPDGELAVCGPQYVADLGKARQSLRKLLDLRFDTLCFAHGTPLRDEAKGKLQEYLETDAVWEVLESEKANVTLSPEDQAEMRQIGILSENQPDRKG